VNTGFVGSAPTPARTCGPGRGGSSYKKFRRPARAGRFSGSWTQAPRGRAKGLTGLYTPAGAQWSSIGLASHSCAEPVHDGAGQPQGASNAPATSRRQSGSRPTPGVPRSAATASHRPPHRPPDLELDGTPTRKPLPTNTGRAAPVPPDQTIHIRARCIRPRIPEAVTGSAFAHVPSSRPLRAIPIPPPNHPLRTARDDTRTAVFPDFRIVIPRARGGPSVIKFPGPLSPRDFRDILPQLTRPTCLPPGPVSPDSPSHLRRASMITSGHTDVAVDLVARECAAAAPSGPPWNACAMRYR